MSEATVMNTPPELGLVEPDHPLIDYALVNTMAPDLYIAQPSAQARAAIKPGDSVKVGIQPHHSSDVSPEHFWADVVQVRTHGYVGRVMNEVQPGIGLKYGDLFAFCGHHVREITSA